MADPTRFLTPLAVTIGIHAVLGAAVVWMEPETRAPVAAVTDIEIVEPLPIPEPEPLPEPEPEPEPVEAEPEPIEPPPEPVEPPPEPAEPPPEPAEPPPEPAAEPPPISAEPAPSWADPAPGEPTDIAPGGTYKLDPITPGSMPVGTGSGRGGPGGPGTGGGAGQPGASGPPRPVSVASLSRRPKPIGNTDFIDARKNYPEEAKRLGIEGQIKVRLIVDAEGKVADRRLVTRLGHGLDQLAMRLAKRLRFEPALDTNQKPVPAVVVWTFDFTLPE